MSTISRETQVVISHPIGAHGTLVLRTVRGSVRVRATDDLDARVEARYAIPPDALSGDPEHDGVLRVTRNLDELRIEADDTGGNLLSALGKMFGGGRPRIDFDVTLPRTATLRLSGVSANLDIRGMRGDQDIRTVSGDVSLVDGGGQVMLQSVSGDTSIQGAEMDLRATTTSGDLDARVGRFRAVRVRTVSGDIRLSGMFDAGPEHSLESISGDVEMAPDNGVTVNMTSVSGSIHADVPHRRDSGPGKRSVMIGDGAATVSFRTMSGDLSMARGATFLAAPGAPPDAAAVDAPAAAAPSPVESHPDGPATAARPRNQLEVLRALERGELSVEAATLLLEEFGDD
jgi:Putative adhesin